MHSFSEKRPLNTELEKFVDELRQFAFARPSNVLTAAKNNKTGETIRRIINAAKRVFVNEGHAGMSLRMVADEAGIAVGNLTYHFATKRELIEAALKERLAEHLDECLDEIDPEDFSPEKTLSNVMALHFRASGEPYQFFYQFWGFAASSPHARAFVDELYAPVVSVICMLSRKANPALSDDDMERVTTQLIAMEQGMKLMTGLRPDDNESLLNAEKWVRALTTLILFNGK